MIFGPIILSMLLICSVGCVNTTTQNSSTPKHGVELIDGDIVATFKHRHDLMRKAMESGDVALAESISAETNAWLETLSYEEQTLISRSLSK